ncbi:MAG: tRNA uridine-5-carboxymethylaminomethyl(34) synthesis GTPase MnmE [Chthoniobacterales bacterium]|nr:tRNA uridine-5-carboxymethylaminomethyl(34) synthesis GTPase MnmE [Chthoniobacterales bacterium]
MGGSDTIAALATPWGAGAVAMVRISGPEAVCVADKIFRGRHPLADARAGRVLRGSIERDGRVLDEVLVTVFRAPRSYTGEDVVEISGHGGAVVADGVLRAAFSSGARPAEPGEFTRRAFLNGKMDLTQAEAVMDLISARGEAAAAAAAVQLSGRLGREVEKLRGETMTALAHLEAFIDFPEEGIDAESGRALLSRVAVLSASIDRLLGTADQGRILREGVRLVIHGRPNAGKSSLLNLLLGYDRAMVSEIPGTTRDTIEENLTLRGIPFRVIDTAGLRESTDDPLEREGMRRTREHLASADVALRVVDATEWAREPARGDKEILVVNKIDLWSGGEMPAGVVPLCCLDARGLEKLVDALVERTRIEPPEWREEAVAINARHQDCLRRAVESLGAARASLERGDAPEFTALELRAALAAVGEITGGSDVDDVLGEIFRNFCIGK